MRLVLDRRARLWPRRLPVPSLYSAGEIALLVLLAVQVARLVYAVVTPLGPIGDWRTGAPAAASAELPGGFDPFFRLANGGAGMVTGLNLKLTGIRSDQATGRGSAIIGLPDGSQQSFAVGEAIVPGVTLKAVAFDHVTIARNGSDEQLYLDQSTPAAMVAPAAPAIAGAPAAPPLPHAPDPLTLLAAAGYQQGDVVVAVNGAKADAASLPALIAQNGGHATVSLIRDGRPLTLDVKVAQ